MPPALSGTPPSGTAPAEPAASLPPLREDTTQSAAQDTNPATEDPEYALSIQNDVRWLGFQWATLAYASDYFQRLYDCAEELIRVGKAFVCSQTEAEPASEAVSGFIAVR